MYSHWHHWFIIPFPMISSPSFHLSSSLLLSCFALTPIPLSLQIQKHPSNPFLLIYHCDSCYAPHHVRILFPMTHIFDSDLLYLLFPWYDSPLFPIYLIFLTITNPPYGPSSRGWLHSFHRAAQYAANVDGLSMVPNVLFFIGGAFSTNATLY